MDYRVGPGDVIRVVVTGEPDFSGSFPVRSDSTIFYSYLKAIEVGGKTTPEIASLLTDVLGRDYINNPSVNVSIEIFSSKKVQVVGAVRSPGTYSLTGKVRLLEIIGMAGGLSNNAGSNVILIRERSAAEPTHKADDALAQVAKTAEDEKTNEGPLSKAPKSKLDPKSKVEAKPNHVEKNTPENNLEPIVINYASIVEEGRLDLNVVIKEGDIINVPTSNEIYVLGQVSRPGPVKFESNLTLLQAISVAGGTLPTASTRSTYIIRKKIDGKSTKIEVRLDRVIAQKADNLPLEANDVIVVPESFF